MKDLKSNTMLPAIAFLAMATIVSTIPSSYAQAEAAQSTSPVYISSEKTIYNHEKDALRLSGWVSAFEGRDFVVKVVVSGPNGEEMSSANVSLLETKTYFYQIAFEDLPAGNYKATVTYHDHQASVPFEVW